ncbi:hypothetical protein ACQP2P_01425 [Dactylosporangium sp. CA-139114]|uniref:hypothetical protein n=1 Tax=Dactylosporangium sp. CA-139114 TaxID=3239931 RepID=UPI003D966F0D
MTITAATPGCVRSENGAYTSRVIGYEVDSDGAVTEILTEYGSVPATTCVLHPSPWRAFLLRRLAALRPLAVTA